MNILFCFHELFEVFSRLVEMFSLAGVTMRGEGQPHEWAMGQPAHLSWLAKSTDHNRATISVSRGSGVSTTWTCCQLPGHSDPV